MSAVVVESGRPLQAAITRSGRCRRPLQVHEAGGGRDGGCYIDNALRQGASTGGYYYNAKSPQARKY
jgi:hypothetical protein